MSTISRRWFSSAGVAVALAFILGCLILQSAWADGGGTHGQHVAGEALAKIRPSASKAAVQQMTIDTDADVAEEISQVSSGSIRRIRSRSKSTDELLAILRADPNVVYAEPNFIVHGTTNDFDFGQLWGLKNTGQPIMGIPGTPGADIKAELAWGVSTGTPTVVVGVVDSGIDYSHPDLAANVWSNPGGVGGCPAGTHGYNAITRSCDPKDDFLHGTHVSGTIGAIGNNSIGVVGVNWTTSIMALKFIDASNNGTIADAIVAIHFAVEAKRLNHVNVRVLNNSWGGGPFTQALLDEINNASANDILFVASAGNNGQNNDLTPVYPASYNAPNVIAVAATDNRDALASFSDYGASSVHLGAPGVNIISTVPGGYYLYESGTSMAAPYVSGVAALVLSTATLTTAQLKTQILNGVDGIQSLYGKTATGGRLNACKAVPGCVRTLTVASSPISGVKINIGLFYGGTTPFTHTYTNTTIVTLTAPPTALSGGNTYTFSGWTGCDTSGTSGQTCKVTVNVDKTITANYVPLRTLTVTSSPTGASITVDKLDQNNQGSGPTPFTRQYVDGTSVVLTAPASLPDGSNSPIWSGCNAASGATCTVLMSSAKTVSVVYRMPIFLVSRVRVPARVVGPLSVTGTVDVSSAAPPSGLTVNLSSSNPAVASVPPTVSVAAGATTSAPFAINTSVVAVSTPVTITANPGNATASLIVDPPVYEGYLDTADCNALAGWAWDPNRPNTPITVDIYVNSALQASGIAANLYRADLAAAGKGNGYHAFVWTVPQSLKNGTTYSMVVKYGGTATALGATPKSVTCTPPSVSVAWVRPAEVTWGPAGTLTVAGYAQNGTGGVTMYWRDATISGGWNIVGYVAPTDASHVWYNTIPSSNNCHTYQVYVMYSGVTSSVFTYNGLTSGYCQEAARVIWMQPQALAGFGPLGSIVLAGSATGAPSGTVIQLWSRDATAGTGWSYQGAALPNGSGIWYGAIQGANASHVYAAYVTYDVITSATCTYAGNNAMNWCP